MIIVKTARGNSYLLFAKLARLNRARKIFTPRARQSLRTAAKCANSLRAAAAVIKVSVAVVIKVSVAKHISWW